MKIKFLILHDTRIDVYIKLYLRQIVSKRKRQENYAVHHDAVHSNLNQS